MDDRLVEPNMCDASGATLLHWAALMQAVDVVRLLLERGANADTEQPTGEKHRPLHWAANSGNTLHDSLSLYSHVL